MERLDGKPSDRQAINKFLAAREPQAQGVMRSIRNVWGRRKPFIKRNELWLWQQEAARPTYVQTKFWR